MNKKKPNGVERIHVEQSVVDIAFRRVEGLVRHACLYSDDVLRDIALSCYLQGAVDALQPVTQIALRAAEDRP